MVLVAPALLIDRELLVSRNLQPCMFTLASGILLARIWVVSCWTQSGQGTAASGKGIWLWCSLFSSPVRLHPIQTLSGTSHEHSLYDTSFWGPLLAPSFCSLPTFSSHQVPLPQCRVLNPSEMSVLGGFLTCFSASSY